MRDTLTRHSYPTTLTRHPYPTTLTRHPYPTTLTRPPFPDHPSPTTLTRSAYTALGQPVHSPVKSKTNPKILQPPPIFFSQFLTAAVLGAVMTTMAAAPLERTAGLLVVGGTESGCAAAVQAARMGVTNIVLVNDIEWLGGQFSAEALGAIDENRETGYDGTVPIPRSGLFREAIDRIETLNSNKYAGIARPGNTLVITTSRPSDSEQVFRGLLAPYEAQGAITRYSGYYPTQALVCADGRTLEGCVFAPVAPGGTSLTVRAALTIDASDWGDAIRLSGAAYMFGPELQSDYGEPLAPVSRATAPLTDMNPVTYCLIAVEQPGESPIPRPAGYDPRDFTLGPWSWLGFADAYTSRRLVDHYAYPQIDHPDVILLNNPHIDYPLVPFPTNVVLALEALEPGASGKNIVEMTRAQRQVVFDDAKQRSLHYFYHLQTVVHSNLADKTHSFLRFALSDEFGTPDRLPPKPYVRESLRLKSAYIVRQQDTLGWASSGLTDHRAFARIMFHDAVMSWQFEYDFHPTQRAFSSAGDPAGPWHAAIVGKRGFGNGGSGKAVFPLRALIPERIDGLLGAQKNLGYTSIVSSSLRLHDQSMAVGQAAGAAAAVALRRGVPARELPWNAGLMAELWDGLLQRSDGAVPVALWPFADLPPEHDAFPAVNQLAVRGLLPEGPYDTFFRADSAPLANGWTRFQTLWSRPATRCRRAHCHRRQPRAARLRSPSGKRSCHNRHPLGNGSRRMTLIWTAFRITTTPCRSTRTPYTGCIRNLRRRTGCPPRMSGQTRAGAASTSPPPAPPRFRPSKKTRATPTRPRAATDGWPIFRPTRACAVSPPRPSATPLSSPAIRTPGSARSVTASTMYFFAWAMPVTTSPDRMSPSTASPCWKTSTPSRAPFAKATPPSRSPTAS